MIQKNTTGLTTHLYNWLQMHNTEPSKMILELIEDENRDFGKYNGIINTSYEVIEFLIEQNQYYYETMDQDGHSKFFKENNTMIDLLELYNVEVA